MNTAIWWLGQNTLTVAVLLPFVVLACRAYRERPAVQHLLWLVVLLKFLTPPVITWPWNLKDIREVVSSHVSAVADQWLRVPLAVDDSAKMLTANRTLARSESESSVPHVVESNVAPFNNSRSTFGGQPTTTILRLVMGLWLCGAVLGAGMQLRRILRHSQLVRSGDAAPETLRHSIRVVATELGLQPPQAVVSPGIDSPFIWCLGYVRLIWPRALSSHSQIARSRGVIAHELAHLQRGDHWVAWLELAAGILCWWNPLYWYVRRRLRESAEMACDALAISTCPERRREYAEVLLELSAGLPLKTGMPAPVLAVSAGTPSSFERRLTMILSDRVSGKVSKWGVVAAFGLAFLVLPGWSAAQQALQLEKPVALNPPDPEVAQTTTPFAAILADESTDQESAKEQNSDSNWKAKVNGGRIGADSILLDLIERGQFEAAKRRLDALRAKDAKVAPQPKQAPEKASSQNWLKDVHAGILGLRHNSAESYQMCLSCHKDPHVVEQTSPDEVAKKWEVIAKKLSPFCVEGISTNPKLWSQSCMICHSLSAKKIETGKGRGGENEQRTIHDDTPRSKGNTSSLELADRYLAATTELKLAKSRMERLKTGTGGASQKDLDETAITLEHAERRVKLISEILHNAILAARAAVETSEKSVERIHALQKKGFVSETESAVAEAQRNEARAQANLLQSILQTVAAPAGQASP